MIREAIQALVDYGRNEAVHKDPTRVNITTDPRKAHLFVGGKLETFDVLPPLRQHRVETVDDLIAAIQRWGDDTSVVYIGERGVVFHLRDTDRRDAVFMPLQPDPVYRTLVLLLDKWHDQSAMIRLLRRELAGLNERDVLLSAVRNVRWRTTEGGASDASLGRESLSLDVLREVSNIDKNFPETATITAAAYVGVPQQYPFVLTIDIAITKKLFAIEPLPDQLSECARLARESIQARLREQFPANESDSKGLTVLLGKPDHKKASRDAFDDDDL